MRATSSPMVAMIPSSSSSSRRSASRGCSPSSIFPPGNSHLRGMVWWRVRWHTRILPSFWISAATTRFIGEHPRAENSAKPGPSPARVPCVFLGSLAGFFELRSDQGGAVLDETLIFGSKRGREMAVNVEFANHSAMDKDGHNNFRFSFERAGQITRIFAHIVDYHGFSARCRRATNALMQRNPRVRRHGALEGSEREHGRLRTHLQHIEADPVVFQHAVVQQLDHLLHQVLRGERGRGKLAHFVADFFHPAGNGHKKNITSVGASWEFGTKLGTRTGTKNGGNLPDSLRAHNIRARKIFRMNRESQRIQPLQQRRRGRVEIFVADAEDAAGAG